MVQKDAELEMALNLLNMDSQVVLGERGGAFFENDLGLAGRAAHLGRRPVLLLVRLQHVVGDVLGVEGDVLRECMHT